MIRAREVRRRVAKLPNTKQARGVIRAREVARRASK